MNTSYENTSDGGRKNKNTKSWACSISWVTRVLAIRVAYTLCWTRTTFRFRLWTKHVKFSTTKSKYLSQDRQRLHKRIEVFSSLSASHGDIVDTLVQLHEIRMLFEACTLVTIMKGAAL